MCPLLAPGFQGFFFLFLLRPLMLLLKQTRQAESDIKQSILLRCLCSWPIREEKFSHRYLHFHIHNYLLLVMKDFLTSKTTGLLIRYLKICMSQAWPYFAMPLRLLLKFQSQKSNLCTHCLFTIVIPPWQIFAAGSAKANGR